jgi:glycosyltransferase involved in cell wall biosynthesis
MQEQALPSGRAVVSCPAPFGVGGLGRHLSEIVAALDRRERPSVYICESPNPSFAPSGRRDLRRRVLSAALAPLARFSPAWRMWSASAGFDTYAARFLPPADELIAFNGTAIAQFHAASKAHFDSLSLVAANSHYRHLIRQHERAYDRYPIERPWATRLLRRNLAEYEQAQRIYVASRYVWESFAEAGFPESVLSLFPLTPDPRFQPAASPPTSASFDVVYVGSLTVHKGVPLLIDAVRRLPYQDLRLVLVGGWGTRGMRRFIEAACAADSRISVRPGDPLPHLQSARLCVHPAYEDGFAYAPAEALACGIPVMVSEDTGMKDLIEPGRNGLVLPTGDLAALTEAIEAAYKGETSNG